MGRLCEGSKVADPHNEQCVDIVEVTLMGPPYKLFEGVKKFTSLLLDIKNMHDKDNIFKFISS